MNKFILDDYDFQTVLDALRDHAEYLYHGFDGTVEGGRSLVELETVTNKLYAQREQQLKKEQA